MPRIGMITIVGSLAACLFFACGDKNAPLSPAGTGGSSVGGVGGSGGEGGSIPGIDGGTGIDAEGAGGSVAVSYKDDIVPLLTKSCSCHTSGAIAPALDTYANVKAAAAASEAAIDDGSMPIAGPLPADEEALFEAWVNAGAPNN